MWDAVELTSLYGHMTDGPRTYSHTEAPGIQRKVMFVCVLK